MEQHGISRHEVAAEMGITRGHLSTLLNCNRTPSQAQANLAIELVGGTPAAPPPAKKAKPKKKRANVRPKQEEPHFPYKGNNLRPMNKFETEFVVTVASAWIEAHPGASKDELVDVVRALSIGIRS